MFSNALACDVTWLFEPRIRLRSSFFRIRGSMRPGDFRSRITL
jgi:hypothetical protein